METPNLTYIKQLAQGDTNFEEQLLQVIRNEFPGEVIKYHEHMDGGELQKAAEMVHKIKHKISILGLEKSYEFTIQYEKELLNGDKSNHEDFFKILTTMSDFLTK